MELLCSQIKSTGKLTAMVAGLLLLLTTATVAAPARPAPTPQAVTEAGKLYRRAANLRTNRVPLRRRVAARNIRRASNQLRRLGVKVDRRVPVHFDSTQEYALLRKTGALLRGVPKGSSAYAMRRDALVRARKLKRTSYGLPRNMRAYANGASGHAELIINLDNAFYAKPQRLVPILAHEYRHVRDIKRALGIEKVLTTAELKNARPGTPQAVRKVKLQRRLDLLWSQPRAETRAFHAQAQAQGLAGNALGNWWRAPQGPQMDQAYPPARLNKALIKGYFKGISKSISSAMRQAPAAKRDVARRYLVGYRDVLKSQSSAYYQAVRKDDQRDPAAIQRYNKVKAGTLKQHRDLKTQAGPLNSRRAHLAGQSDAYRGIAPVQRVRQILAD